MEKEKEEKITHNDNKNNHQPQKNSSTTDTESHLAKLVTISLIQEINQSLILIKISEFIL
jgi:hypothetical protein